MPPSRRSPHCSLVPALWVAAALLLGACGGEGTVELGVGEGQYRTFADGETLDLVTGCQGFQHVWVGVRTEGLNPRGMIVDLALVRDRDQVTVSSPFVVRLSLDEGPDGTHQQVGMTLIVPEPDEAIGEDLTLTATVTDRDDLSALDARPVRIDWGEGGCR